MGINMGMVYVEGAAVEDLAAVGLRPTGARSSADEASTSPDDETAVARRVGDWLVLVGPLLLVATEDEMLARTLGRRVVAAMFGSTGDVYSFAVCAPDGTRRHLVDSSGRREVDEGEALPQEEGVELLTEDTVQELLTGVTGLDVWDSFFEQDWEVLEGEGVFGGAMFDDPDLSEAVPAPSVEAYPAVEESPSGPIPSAQEPQRKGFFARLLGR